MAARTRGALEKRAAGLRKKTTKKWSGSHPEVHLHIHGHGAKKEAGPDDDDDDDDERGQQQEEDRVQEGHRATAPVYTTKRKVV